MKKTLVLIGAILLILTSYSFAKEFIDVGEKLDSYKDAISFVSEKEIMVGYPDGTFKPEKKVTRAETAKLLCVAFNLVASENSDAKELTDVKGLWSEEYVKKCVSLGIIKGYEDNTFRPNNEVKYGELCAMILRLLNVKVDEGDDWARAYLSAASEAGLLDGIITNDVVAINSAPRMNVAMAIYNAVNFYKEKKEDFPTSGDNTKKEEEPKKEDPKKDEPKEDTPSVDVLEPNKEYYGMVVLEKNQRGIDYIEVKTIDGLDVTLEVKKEDKKPELDSIILLESQKDGKIHIIKELKQDSFGFEDLLYVEETDGKLAAIKGKDSLDIELDKYELNGTTIKLNSLNYYLVEVSLSKDKYVLDDCEHVEKENVKFKKEDRLLFDTKSKLLIILRGIEEV